MPIKNYTTTVPADKSIAEIQVALVQHGAKGVMYSYDDEGRISAMRFVLDISGQPWNYALPVEWRKFQQVLKNDGVRRWDDDAYCYRVAWRNLRDWVLAQMALYETQIVEMPQVFLPFATDAQGKTLYEYVNDNPKFLLE
jgi:hypothetical protein